MTAAAATLAPARLAGLDRLRGLAVALMVVDHGLAFAHTGSALRDTATRLAMPAFVLVAGALNHSPSRRTQLRRLAGAAAIPVLMLAAGLPGWLWLPQLLVVLALLRAGGAVWQGVLVAMIVAAAANTPGQLWDAYTVEFGYPWFAPVVLAYVGAHLLDVLNRAGTRLPTALGVLGRYPLAFYAGHLVVLAVLRQGGWS